MRKRATKKEPKPRVKKPRVSTGKERKDFAVKMLVDNPKPAWQVEMAGVKRIFEQYPVEFLIKVSKPSFRINSCFFFLTEDGKEYLSRKLKEFLYIPKRYDIVDGENKVGEDWTGTKRKGFREFVEGSDDRA